MRKKQSKYTCPNFADMIRILSYRYRQSSKEDLEDASGHAFLRGIEHFDSEFPMKKESLSWLLRVASNYLLDKSKKKRLHHIVSLDEGQFDGYEPMLDASYLEKHLDCSMFIKTLTRNVRITLVLWLKGSTPLQIAEILEVSKDAVYKRLRKCRKLFVMEMNHTKRAL